MKIKKRDGSYQAFMPNKLLNRIKEQSKGLRVDSHILFQEVVPLIRDGYSTKELDELIAFKAADKITEHPDYSILGGRLLLSRQSKLIDKPLKDVDLTYDFFSATTFLSKYSKKIDDKTPIELPSCMYERVSNFLSNNESEYNNLLDELSKKRINFATPIYTNAAVEKRGGMISCNLTHLEDDSIEGIENTLTKIAYASKEGAGIGLLIDPIRSEKSTVSSFNGRAGGVVRLADMVQSKMRFYKQGSRSGSCALYLSLWHRDILEFLDLTLPIGDEQLRTRDLFTAVIINDPFMEELQKEDGIWYLFCPNDIKNAGLRPLYDLNPEEFRIEYNKAVEMGLGSPVEPKKVWDSIIKSQVESGKPYVMYKDNANKRNMQSNIGVIKNSNLCIEIFEASKPRYTAQCTLGSINLGEQESLETIDKSVRTMVRALNCVIDKNKWSDDWSKSAGEDQRALAIGVAGLADFFAKRKISFESDLAKDWNRDIFETMYKAALDESHKMALELGKTYPAWEGSPYSRGETYIEGWSPLPEGVPIPVLNSLFLGLMPTASSAILLGVFESFEPVTGNLFTRRVGQGEFLVINKWLVNELDEMGLWNHNMKNKIIKNSGSVQNITEIPEDVRFRYKDVWEISQKTLVDLSAIRNKYVDQSQSLNIYHQDAKYTKISSALVYAWKVGLKTGVYYTRTKSKIETNSKLSSDSINVEASLPKRPENSPFTCAGGGCDA
jgi:ribonucleoside-diphosphate reductase alpha chain